MNAPDWTVIERCRDAQRVSEQFREKEARDRAQMESEMRTNAVCMAIRKADLTEDAVKTILYTLACEMTRVGFHPVKVAGVEDAADL